jgi:hypothetical protein
MCQLAYSVLWMTTKDQTQLGAKLKYEIELVMPAYTIQGRERKGLLQMVYS